MYRNPAKMEQLTVYQGRLKQYLIANTFNMLGQFSSGINLQKREKSFPTGFMRKWTKDFRANEHPIWSHG